MTQSAARISALPAAIRRPIPRLGHARARLRALAGRRHFWGVAAVAAATALLHGAFEVQQYHRFRVGGYDLVIFDQAIRDYAHGRLPVSMFKDVHDAAQVAPGYAQPFSILGDHFSPILALLAPLYWIWNNPQVLLLAQAALFGLAVPSVWAFARRALLRIAPPRKAAVGAYLTAAAFGLSWPLQEATQAGFHEVAFFVPLSAMLVERYQARRLGQAVACAVALLLVKEDAGYVVAAFGLLLLVTRRVNGEPLERDERRRYRITGVALGVGGVAFAMAVLHLWIPAYGGRVGFYWYYGQLGPDMLGALKTLITDPGYAFQVATQPDIKINTLYFLFWPYLYLSLASPLCLLAAPLLAERLFSDKPEHWTLDQHYNAFLAAILIMAAADGLIRVVGGVSSLRPRLPGRVLALRRARPWFAVGWPALILLFAVVITHTFPIRSVFNAGQWSADALTTAQTAATAMIPSGVCVEADDDVATHLSSRDQVILLDQVPRGCPWVVLQTAQNSYPLNDILLAVERAHWLRQNGYQLVFNQAKVYVYHRV
ncbi:DUF2079 domain-containing protein [Actinocrinis puniceicyclus]|uniref:DUF2079 domain-containing protein n=1 Tax=Actinocrinis puniceicyclus TaxID=977794 RepID=A0A8J8BDG6_9ACTN|nr:DUF2079 domain-containing protein [Actinocrinis puniceicyclus]MBS2964465.1 DUF2079 domain-containing protein [Actinocrinis puniceicyclus]